MASRISASTSWRGLRGDCRRACSWQECEHSRSKGSRRAGSAFCAGAAKDSRAPRSPNSCAAASDDRWTSRASDGISRLAKGLTRGYLQARRSHATIDQCAEATFRSSMSILARGVHGGATMIDDGDAMIEREHAVSIRQSGTNDHQDSSLIAPSTDRQCT